MRIIATLSDGAEIESRTVVIATGVAYLCLDVPSLERFAGAGVLYGAAMGEAPTCTGEEVLIVGAGNSDQSQQDAALTLQDSHPIHPLGPFQMKMLLQVTMHWSSQRESAPKAATLSRIQRPATFPARMVGQ